MNGIPRYYNRIFDVFNICTPPPLIIVIIITKFACRFTCVGVDAADFLNSQTRSSTHDSFLFSSALVPTVLS